MNFSVVLLIAGHITITALLGNTVLCVDEYPDVWAELHADRSLVPAAIKEVLRYRSSFTQVGRVTMVETELSGQIIPADVVVTPWLLSANRDEREFADPDRFDIHRPLTTMCHSVPASTSASANCWPDWRAESRSACCWTATPRSAWPPGCRWNSMAGASSPPGTSQ